MSRSGGRPPLRLSLLRQRLAICRTPASRPPRLPRDGAGLLSFVRSEQGWTVVCPPDQAPAGAEVDAGWRALQVQGPLPLTATGILSRLATCLAAAGVPLFALCSFETDYLLVPEARLDEALAALTTAGHLVNADTPNAPGDPL